MNFHVEKHDVEKGELHTFLPSGCHPPQVVRDQAGGSESGLEPIRGQSLIGKRLSAVVSPPFPEIQRWMMDASDLLGDTSACSKLTQPVRDGLSS